MLLAEPLELIDLHAGESMMLRIDSFQDGTTVIHPRVVTPRHVSIHMQQQGLSEPPPQGTPIRNEVPALRLYGRRLDQPNDRPYWDVTSKHLRADLLARLTNNANLPITVTLTANGHAPQKRYSVSVA